MSTHNFHFIKYMCLTNQYKCNEQPSQSLSKPRRWKSMLIHQGWFTALYTQHLRFTVASLKFAYFQGGLSRHITSPTEKTRPESGTTWVRQPRSGGCHHPTAATKCNEQPSQSHSKPRRWKSMLIPRVVYCAIYPILTIHSLEFEICIFPREAIPSHKKYMDKNIAFKYIMQSG